MSVESVSAKPTIPVFTGEGADPTGSYIQWVSGMSAALMVNGLWDLLCGSESVEGEDDPGGDDAEVVPARASRKTPQAPKTPKPKPTSSELFRAERVSARQVRVHKLYGFIVMACPRESRAAVVVQSVDVGDGVSAWRELATTFLNAVDHSPLVVHGLLGEVRWRVNDSVLTFLDRLRVVRARARTPLPGLSRDPGMPQDCDLVRVFLLRVQGHEALRVRVAQDNRVASLSFNQLELLVRQVMHDVPASTRVDPTPSASMASVHGAKPDPSNFVFSIRDVSLCPCVLCLAPDHSLQVCPQFVRQQKYYASQKRRAEKAKAKTPKKHVSAAAVVDMPTSSPPPVLIPPPADGDVSVGVSQGVGGGGVEDDDAPVVDPFAAMVVTGGDGVTKEAWVVDSGSNVHVCPDQNAFHSLTLVSDSPGGEISSAITTGSGSSHAEGVGVVRLLVETDVGVQLIELCDVLYAPSFPFGLLSVSRLSAREGCGLVSIGRPRLVLANANVVLSEQLGLYVLPTVSDDYVEGLETPALSMASAINVDTEVSIDVNDLHVRLGHACEEATRAFAKAGGIKLTGGWVGTCHVCARAKSIRASVARLSDPVAVPSPGRRIDSDLMGPYPVGVCHTSYGLVLVDVDTKVTVVKLLRDKTPAHVADAVIRFANKDAPLWGLFLKDGSRFHTDSDSVFLSAEFQSKVHAALPGVLVFEASAPHTQQRNGVAESSVNFLKATARAIMCNTKADNRLWPLALQHAAFLRNLLPGTGGGRRAGLIPVVVSKGLFPHKELALLHPFGVKVYVHIEKPLRDGAFSDTARLGLYVGLDMHTRSHLVYVFDSGRVVSSAHVKFCTPVPAPAADLPAALAPTLGVASLVPRLSGSLSTPVGLVMHKGSFYDEFVFPKDMVFSSFVSTADTEKWAPVFRPHVPTKKEAVASEAWRRSMAAEVDAIRALDSFDTVPLSSVPRGTQVLHSKFVFSVKQHPDGSVRRLKSRLVVLGHLQRDTGGQTFAPTPSLVAVRLVFCVAAQRLSEGWNIVALDVSNAFLQAPLSESERAYVHFPEPHNLRMPNGARAVAFLKKALYGLRCSPAVFSRCLVAALRSMGFTRCESESCLFVLKTSSGSLLLLVIVFVDDLLVAGLVDAINSFVAALAKRFSITGGEDVECYLGLGVTVGPGSITLSQPRYVPELIAEVGKVKTFAVPMVAHQPVLDLDASFSTPGDANDLLPAAEHALFRKIIGSLLFLVSNTRFDVAYAVSQLSRFVAKPRKHHLRGAMRVLGYLQQTGLHGLRYQRQVGRPYDEVVIQTDCSFAGLDDCSSQGGLVVLVAGTPVDWKSHRLSSKPVSTAEAEYVAAAFAVRAGLFVSHMLEEMGLRSSASLPMVLQCDAESAIDLLQNPCSSKRTRHIAVQYHFARQQVETGKIEIKHRSGKELEADVLTKPVPGPALATVVGKFLVKL
eukprot:m.415735 g.415735  ORF g.415735 m.415735 type:complete len:1444 (-) comp20178_c0_seq4:286-4617(-)